jgi:DnaJ-class molecular chaperone
MTIQSQTLPEGYAHEICGLCGGIGKGGLGTDEPCPPCNATGKVVVLQPPIKCPRCKGDGKSKRVADGLAYAPRLCVVCRGSGWARSLVA